MPYFHGAAQGRAPCAWEPWMGKERRAAQPWKGLTLRAVTVAGCDFSFCQVLLDFKGGGLVHVGILATENFRFFVLTGTDP